MCVKRSYLPSVVLLVLAVVWLGGCGGDSVSNNTFAGTYTGDFNIPGTGEVGTMSLTVDSTGAVTGNFTNTTAGIGGTITGQIDDSGQFNGVLNVPGVLVDVPLSGTLVTQPNGHVTGTLVQSGLIDLIVDLAPA